MARNAISVEIFGQTYALRSDFPEEVVRDVAQYVDGKMREVAASTKTVNTLHVAILAALTIAQDCLQERKEKNEFLKRVEENTKRLDEFIVAHLG
jgi:cell division protein ZapA